MHPRASQSSGRTIALVDFFDWNHGGHFRMLYKLMAGALLKSGHRVIAVCQYPEEINYLIDEPAYRDRLIALHSPTDERARLWWRSRYWWERRFPKWRGLRQRRWESRRMEYYDRFFERIAAERGWKVDALFFPSFTDYLELPLPHIPWKDIPSGGLWMTAANFLTNGISVTGRPIPASTLESIRKNAAIRMLCIHDECLLNAFASHFPDKHLLTWPEVTPEAEPNWAHPIKTEIARRARDRLVITCIGVMDRRKGVIPLLHAAEQLPDCFFVFAGPDLYPNSYAPDERAYFEDKVKNPPENCLFRLERIDDDGDFNVIIAASDVMYVAYIGLVHSSNVMTKAAILRRPIILSDRPGCLLERSRRHNLGLTIPEGSAADTVTAIRQLKRQKDDGSLHQGRDYDEFARIHSRSALARRMEEAVALICQETR